MGIWKGGSQNKLFAWILQFENVQIYIYPGKYHNINFIHFKKANK